MTEALTPLIVLPRAKQDLQEHYDWIANRSIDGANRWADAFEDALLRLRHDLESYGIAPEEEVDGETVRQFFFKTRRGRIYRGLFVVSERVIFILHVRGPRQRLMHRDEIEGP